ncbi:hypothetical protein OWR29_13125 [Actinoplanes sp. Pm04-4]|jgi:hypothetical protein|uniref:FeoB-associated Cys-rich membrane protein n=1 Tax=Paractinoplanes pyxinae TaxID=2997416 RepID=A0ABT4AXL3_9ACTN|nr:hypothetical protein [Actinoplanes pyxinae]MCY1138944.1 hypothetical protein [Actinoplanes pyxinae]
MILVIAVGSALVAGFLAGFVCFKKTNEFCGRCGITRECPVCSETPRAGGGDRRGELMRAAIS